MGTFPRVTHPSATQSEDCVRLACVRPAASVRSEPGSNSQVEEINPGRTQSNQRKSIHPKPRLTAQSRIDGFQKETSNPTLSQSVPSTPKKAPSTRKDNADHVSLSSFPTMSKSKRPRNPNEPAITANQKSANSQTPAKPTGTIPQNTPEEAKPPKTLKSAGADAQRSTPGIPTCQQPS